MERRKLGRTGLTVSLLGLGALEVGRNWGLGDEEARERPSAEAAGAVLNQVLDMGITLVDTARAYHRSEERIGEFIGHRRQEYVLASKCGEHSSEPDTYYDFSYQAVLDSINLSLEKLQTSIIDIMQIHFGPEPEQVLADGETVRAMKEAREQGKIRLLGASAPTHLLDACIDSGDFDVLQVHYNILDRQAERAIARAHEKGIGILVRFPLALGLLTPKATLAPAERQARVKPYLDLVDGDYVKLHALGLQFLAANPGVSSILAGSKNAEHVRQNIERLTMGLDPGLLEEAIRVGQPA